MSTPTQHSALGASLAHRWLACPGSIRMCDGVEDSGVRSPYAAEGTLAHEYAEKRLQEPEPNDVVELFMRIPEEIPEYVDLYIQLIRKFQEMCEWWEIEHRFDLAVLNPPVDAYGTADFVGYNADEREVIVVDLKYGTGVLVEVEDNKQLMYYALGAVLSYQKDHKAPIDRVRMIIVQPRAEHPDGRIREATVDIHTLMDFSFTLIEGMHKTQQPNAKLIVGKHCRFCRAAAICPELFRENQRIAQTEFSKLPEGEDMLAVAANPVAMTNDEVGVLLKQLDTVEHWITSVRIYAQNELESGRKIQGWKLVAKQARRKWAKEKTAVDWLLEFAGLPVNDLMVTKLKSPAQIEKMIPSINILPDLIVKQSSGTKIARSSSPLPEIIRGSDFKKLP